MIEERKGDMFSRTKGLTFLFFLFFFYQVSKEIRSRVPDPVENESMMFKTTRFGF